MYEITIHLVSSILFCLNLFLYISSNIKNKYEKYNNFNSIVLYDPKNHDDYMIQSIN